MQKVAVINST